MVGAVGPYPPSPIPTKIRVAKIAANVACETGACRGKAPKDDADAYDDPSGKPIGEETQNRRREHVCDEKGGSEQSGIFHCVWVVRGEKSGTNTWLYRSENITIDVVKEVDPQQEGQRTLAPGLRFLILLARHRIADCTEQPAPCKHICGKIIAIRAGTPFFWFGPGPADLSGVGDWSGATSSGRVSFAAESYHLGRRDCADVGVAASDPVHRR